MGAVIASVERWYRPDRPSYRGIYCQQFEEDLDRYAELVAELAPPFVVEIGRSDGGTALLLADRLHETRPDAAMVSIDIEPPGRLINYGRGRTIRWVTASSSHPTSIQVVRDVARRGRGLILLDGDHEPAQVAAELDLYADWADYLVVEDTIMRHLGNRVGPHMALDAWLPDHPEFTPDPDPVLTQHPGGWLRRIR